MPRSLYRQLVRRLRRLPADDHTVGVAVRVAHAQFESESRHVGSRRIKAVFSLLDDILIAENWGRLPDVYDAVYKTYGLRTAYPEHDELCRHFNGLNYDQLRPIYPQVHLLGELAVPEKLKKTFESELAAEHDTFSLMDHFGLDPQPSQLRPMAAKSGPGLEPVVQKVQEFHQFLVQHQRRLTHLKIDSFEALYPTNKFGQPLHIIQRDKILQQKLTEVKGLLKMFVPVAKHHLQAVEQDVNQRNINAHFFRYIKHKRRAMPDVVLKGGKRFVPDAKNLVKIHKEYLMKQFYAENGQYRVIWISNFYE